MKVKELLSVIATPTKFKLFAINCYNESFQVGGDDEVVCGRNKCFANNKVMDNEVNFVNIKGDEMEIYIHPKD